MSLLYLYSSSFIMRLTFILKNVNRVSQRAVISELNIVSFHHNTSYLWNLCCLYLHFCDFFKTLKTDAGRSFCQKIKTFYKFCLWVSFLI